MRVTARRLLALGLVTACAAATAAAPGLTLTAQAAAHERPLVDFNHDGFGDMVVGIPWWDGSSGGKTIHHAGRIQVIYGSASGFDAGTTATFDRDSSGVPGSMSDSLDWGSVTATGDFNNDGYTDIAVGDPTTALRKGGDVTVLYGSASGITGAGATFLDQSSDGVPSTNESGDQFGAVLHAGDINGDGRDDLVVGVPGERAGSSTHHSGTVDVLFGSSHGLTGVGAQSFSQASSGVPSASGSDQWGRAFAVGDFDGDGKADLAVGEYDRTVSGHSKAGLVDVLYGTSSGLRTTGLQRWSQSSSGIAGASETGDHFGWQVTAGDFNGDGRADLAVSTGGEEVAIAMPGGSKQEEVGAVNVIYGSANGLTSAGNIQITQNTAGLASHNAPTAGGTAYRSLGTALVAGDLDGDGKAELAVKSYTGVTVLHGTSSGLSTTSSKLVEFPDYTDGAASSRHPYAQELAIVHPAGASSGVLAVGDARPSVSDAVTQDAVYLWTPTGALPTTLPTDPDGQVDPGVTGLGTFDDNPQYGAGLAG